jgi:hypothetical protein
MKRTGFAKILALCTVFVTVLGVLPLVMAADNFENDTVQITVEDSGYPVSIVGFGNQDWFFPGDTIDLTLDVSGIDDTLEDVFDIIIFKSGETLFADNVGIFDDISIDPDSGEARVTISSTKTMALPDGDYDVYVGDEQWIEDDGFDSGRNEWPNGQNQFRIQMYIIIAETDSAGYLPGDDVNVFYSVISIKDGRLITEESFEDVDFDDREWGVWTEDGESTEGPTSLSEQSGSFDFTISTVGSAWPDDYIIGIWFNGTYGSDREASTFLTGNMPGQVFRVDTLDLDIWTDRGTYQHDSVVVVTVEAEVAGTNAPEPDVDVEITILEGTGVTADKISGYGGDDFATDAAGRVVYAFSVDPSDFDEDETFTVRVNASKHLKEAGREVTFDVAAGGRAIATNMVFDKETYTTGDTVNVNVETAVPSGASTDFTYIYVVETGSGTKAQEVSDSPLFRYDIPNNFEGTLRFSVEVYNADGDQGVDVEDKEVHYAVLLLNAEPEQYLPGDTITAEYELISTLMDSPSFFFVVEDAAGLIVLEGEIVSSAMDGSFEYTVPDVASNFYLFNIMANQDGVAVETFDACWLIGGYDVEIWVDNPTYTPGERVTIHYEIKPRGDEGLPDKFVFSYGMSNGPQYTWQSDSPKGDIFYELPGGVNEGDIWIYTNVMDGDGNWVGGASESLHIQDGASALEWTRALDVPLFSWILLLLIILLIIFMLFRRPAAPAPEKAPAEAPPEPAPAEEEMAPISEEASPLAINCKSCGAEIEITTSKRPIEVMCPSCGETEMVE